MNSKEESQARGTRASSAEFARYDQVDKPDDEPQEKFLPADPNDRPEIDPQLETALLVMRVHLLGETTPQMAFQGGPKDVSVK